MAIDQKFLAEKTHEYAGEYEGYAAYADFLRKVFETVRSRIAPLAIVEARPKAKASYAEKVVRKLNKFRDPRYHITDKCGARVITLTIQEKKLFCDYIKLNFIIDEENSLDVRDRMKENEFGYLSVHYVVQIKACDTQLEGIAVPASIKKGAAGYKAEIQVRTLLEHAWANTMHDRLYKVDIEAPMAIRREAAALAATMEEADARFARISQGIDDYLGNYAAYFRKDRMERETEILKAARATLGPNERSARASLTLRLARMARLSGNLDVAIAEIEGEDPGAVGYNDAFNLELGQALCLRHQADVRNPEFARGQDLLRKVAEAKDDSREPALPHVVKIRAEAARLLGWSYTLVRGREIDARDAYQMAVTLDPCNPYHLAAFLEFEIYMRRDYSFVSVMRTTIEQAISICRSHIAVGIQIPEAYFVIARFLLLLGEVHEALRVYAKAVRVTLAPDSSVSETVLDEEIAFFNRVNPGRKLPPEQDTACRLLKLARALKHAGAAARFDLSELISSKAGVIREYGPQTALIVAGAGTGMDQGEMAGYKPFLVQMLDAFEGVVCSGGTRVGISGLVGEVADELRGGHQKKFMLAGFLSGRVAIASPKDDRYDLIVATDRSECSELEPIQMWIDLLAAGIRPSKVTLLGINGGTIAAFEYRLALALGARVYVIANSGRAADDIFKDADWAKDSSLVRLPREMLDEATIRAMVRVGAHEFAADDLERLGEIAHRNYLALNPYSDIDPARKDWKNLREDLKESNRMQVAYTAEILKTEGYTLQKADGSETMPEFSDEEIERMARLEHGRWNIERLASGWKHGPSRDIENRISPYLCCWDKLPERIKGFDRNAVRNYAVLFRKSGWSIRKAAIPVK